MTTRTETLRPVLRADRGPCWKPILAALDEGVGLLSARDARRRKLGFDLAPALTAVGL